MWTTLFVFWGLYAVFQMWDGKVDEFESEIGKSEHFVLSSALIFFRPLFSEWKEKEGSGRKAEYCLVETATHYLAVFFPGNPSNLEGMDLKVKCLPLSFM